MNIETLQIKRVTSNWDKKKNYVPALGEFVLINIKADPALAFIVTLPGKVEITIDSGISPFFVMGTGNDEDTLEKLVKNGNIYLPCTTEMKYIDNFIAATDPPTDVDANSEAVGTSEKLARADHKHKLTKDTVESLLSTDISTLGYRKIMMGTQDPNDPINPLSGKKGDIYIRYEGETN